MGDEIVVAILVSNFWPKYYVVSVLWKITIKMGSNVYSAM